MTRIPTARKPQLSRLSDASARCDTCCKRPESSRLRQGWRHALPPPTPGKLWIERVRLHQRTIVTCLRTSLLTSGKYCYRKRRRCRFFSYRRKSDGRFLRIVCLLEDADATIFSACNLAACENLNKCNSTISPSLVSQLLHLERSVPLSRSR